eukprot:2221036-Prymnesium_polylepis.1
MYDDGTAPRPGRRAVTTAPVVALISQAVSATGDSVVYTRRTNDLGDSVRSHMPDAASRWGGLWCGVSGEIRHSEREHTC